MTSQHQVLEAAGELLRRYRVFLTSSHVRLDCDGLAAELALAHVLGAMGKRVHVVNPDPVARSLQFLPGSGSVRLAGQGHHLPDDLEAVVILDCPDLERTGSVAALLPGGLPFLSIDHHPGASRFADVTLSDPSASSTCELLYRVFTANGLPVSAEAATNLYAGILSDTGRFCYSNTTAQALAVASELVRLGADPVSIGHHLYEDLLLGQLRLWAEVVESIEVVFDGRVAVAVISEDMLRRHSVSAEDTQDFAEIPRLVAGVQVGVLLRELATGEVKVSLRSRGPVDVNAMAARLGGGGHRNASGVVVAGSLNDVRREVLGVVEELLTAGTRPGPEDEEEGERRE